MPIRQLVQTIRNAFSGEAAKAHVAEIIRHHRIQASPGYRGAANYVLGVLENAGISAHIETHPANENSTFWSANSFQEWDCQSATLYLTNPADKARKLADYRDLKLSVIQRSTSFSGEVEVVEVKGGTKLSDYDGLEIAGKMVLTSSSVSAVQRIAVNQLGAVGILFDGMASAPPVREPMDLPDARQYTSFWWVNPEDTKCFGFVLSPRQGQWLRQLIANANKPVLLQADVQAELYDGTMENVTALIPGTTKEEVLVVSHLCHPQPSANDNATGDAANLETALTLHKLIQSGQLSPPKRGIRFLWMPEMTGTYAYLSRHEADIPHMVAGLNLDMVGEDQELTGAVQIIERPPESMASFAPDLLARLREELFDDAKSLTEMSTIPLFRHAITAFSGGSDHYIFSDPTVGVPMPMLINWPDKFYHTSADTLEKVSPKALARAGILAAAYAYFIATADTQATTWLAHEMVSRFQQTVTQLVQTLLTDYIAADAHIGWEQWRKQSDYLLARFEAALASLQRLDGGWNAGIYLTFAKKHIQQEQKRLNQGLGKKMPIVSRHPLDPHEQEAATLIPTRLYRGPSDYMSWYNDLAPTQQQKWATLLQACPAGGMTIPVLAEYWADGKRTILQIIDLVEQETGIRVPELILYKFKFMAQKRLVSLRSNA